MKICVYGASSNELDAAYIEATEALGYAMGQHGHSLIFGGGASGMMGAAARGMTKAGGDILGVAPSFFNVDGVLYDKCTDFIYTETMHERKFLMEEKADAFIIAPGSIGTLEEFFEALTLKQLGRHNKPIVLYNVHGYFDILQQFLAHVVEEKFMRQGSLDLVHCSSDVEEILDYLEHYDDSRMTPEQMKFL